MNDNLEKIIHHLELVDTKTSIEEFVQAFSLALDYIKQDKDVTEANFKDIFNQLDQFASKLKGDNEEDRTRIKTIVGEAIAELRIQVDAKIAGIDGQDGKDGKDGAPGLQGLPGKDAVDASPDEIVAKVNDGTTLVKKERVEGLLDIERMAQANALPSVGVTTTNFFKNGTLIGRAKNINFIEGSNISYNLYQTGDQMNVSASSTAAGGGTVVSEEVPIGSGTSFTIAHTPIAGTFKLYRGGSRQQATVDFTLSGTTLTLTQTLIAGEILLADYLY